MRSIVNLLVMIGLLLCFSACSENGDNTDGLKLSAQVSNIQANGSDKAVFTVTFNGENVTEKAVVKEKESGNVIENATFTTSVPGEYHFVAEYAGNVSEMISITAEKGEGFKKNILLIKFTAIGCYTCPEAERYIKKAQKDLPGRIYPMAVYGTIGVMKDFMVDEYVNSYLKQFSFNEYPTVILDHKDKWNPKNGIQDMVFEKALKMNGEIGIALATTLDGDHLKIDVKVKGQKLINYSTNLVVVILENNLYAVQTGAISEEENYHYHVVRKFLTDLYGDENKIEKGTIDRTKEYSRSFDYTIPSEYKKGNLDVMVYLLKTSDRSALNCQSVQAGKEIDYEAL